MKLSKNEGGVYVASFKTIEGKTKKITTRCRDKDEARAVVKESGIEDLERAAKAGRLTREAIGHITTGKKLTLVKAILAWEQWMKNVGKTPKTIANSLAVIGEWVKEGKLESLPPSAIDERHINSFINDDESETKAGTRAVKLASIRSFFMFCSAKGWSLGNPAQLVKVNMTMLTHMQKEVKEKQVFTAAEIRQLVKAAEARSSTFWKFAVLISNEIGLRLGDICQLEWECFTKPGRVVVWTDKRDKRISVPVSEAVLELVTEIPVSSPRYLFPEERDIVTDPKRRALLSVQFTRICKSVGIYGKSFHSLRHSCITRWSKEGKSLEEIGKDVAHSNESTTKGYIHA